jgi:PilZ domain-containing protein
MDPRPAGPGTLPASVEVKTASAKGLKLVVPQPLTPGAVLEFDLLLGARPLPVMARVLQCAADGPRQMLDVEFVAMAQVDRDALVDFLTAVGPSALRVRRHQED